MKRFIITEDEKKYIKSLYGLLKEQSEDIKMGGAIMDSKNIQVNTEYITYGDENGMVSNSDTLTNGGKPIKCKVIQVKDKVKINGRTYKLIKAINVETNNPCGDLIFNGGGGWMAMTVNINEDGAKNIVSGSMRSPTITKPKGTWSFGTPWARENQYSLFSITSNVDVTGQITSEKLISIETLREKIKEKQTANLFYFDDNPDQEYEVSIFVTYGNVQMKIGFDVINSSITKPIYDKIMAIIDGIAKEDFTELKKYFENFPSKAELLEVFLGKEYAGDIKLGFFAKGDILKINYYSDIEFKLRLNPQYTPSFFTTIGLVELYNGDVLDGKTPIATYTVENNKLKFEEITADNPTAPKDKVTPSTTTSTDKTTSTTTSTEQTSKIKETLIVKNGTDYVDVKSQPGDPWSYRYNKDKKMWETKKSPGNWILVDPNNPKLKAADTAIRSRYEL